MYTTTPLDYARGKQTKSLDNWVLRHLDSQQLREVVEHGCDSGCVGDLIYYHDVLAFYRKFESQIWETVFNYIESTGETLGQFIDSTRLCVADETTFKNFLVWFVIEHKAQEMLAHLDEG